MATMEHTPKSKSSKKKTVTINPEPPKPAQFPRSADPESSRDSGTASGGAIITPGSPPPVSPLGELFVGKLHLPKTGKATASSGSGSMTIDDNAFRATAPPLSPLPCVPGNLATDSASSAPGSKGAAKQ